MLIDEYESNKIETMANQKKRLEFENSFGNNSRSPKRPKLEVIQRPSTTLSRNESFASADENDDLWGDELENDVVEEVLLLESQAFTQKPQTPKSESCQNLASGVFKPKIPRASSAKNIFGTLKDLVPKDNGIGIGLRETKGPDRRVLNPPAPVSSGIQPLLVEKVKSHVIGKGCPRSNSMPTSNPPHSSSTHPAKPWSEIKDLSRKMVGIPLLADSNRPPGAVLGINKNTENEINDTLRKEIEKLRSEVFTKAGEAALLRQKIKDAGVELERERHQRATLLEKTNQKHQQEMTALSRELEAAKTQLQFKELDVDKAVEKCKLLEAGNLKVRPMEFKFQSQLRPISSSSDFPNRSTFEDNTPKKKSNTDSKKKIDVTVQKPVEHETVKMKASEVGIQTDERFEASQRPSAELFNTVSEGEMLSRLIVPSWFEMDSGANEEQFENKWEGVAAVTEIFKLTTFEGKPLERIIEWCWKRMLAFLSILRKRSEDDYKFHKIREESRRQYEEWCLDRRIPLPPQKQSIDEGLKEDWFRHFAEESFSDEMQCLLSYRPWCPKDVMPEIRRTLALIVALMKVSGNVAPVLGSYNQSKKVENSSCYTCGSFIENERISESVKLTGENISFKDNENSFSCTEVPIKFRKKLVTSDSVVGMEKKVKRELHSELVAVGGSSTITVKPPEGQKEEEIDCAPKDILKFDFVHLVQQICEVVSGMRKILPMEGTVAGALVFLSSLNEQLVLSERGLSLIATVIKDVLFMRPRLRILILLMRLLAVTGEYPLIMQKLCLNAAWNTAYRDRWKNIWMFSKGVCPLQVLITVLENATDERVPNGVSQVAWFKYRAKLGLHFIQWLNIALSQPGHQVDWLCYALDDECEEERRQDEDSIVHQDEKSSADSVRKVDVDCAKESVRNGNESNSGVTKENLKPSIGNIEQGNDKMETEEKYIPEEDPTEDMPYKTLSEHPCELSISKLSLGESEDEKEEMKEPNKRCCCRRWMMNILVNILFAILSDFQSLTNADYKLEVKHEADKLLFNTRKSIPANKLLVLEQSLCLKLGIFVLRDLLRRGHPEFNTPGGEGFLWNHYTVKGTILINGQIVMKDYSHKNTHGGPIGGRYMLLLSKIDKQMKDRILEFCPETEKALQELLEVEYSLQSPSECEEEESNIWDCMKSIGCNEIKNCEETF